MLTGRLDFWTSSQTIPNKHFRTDLFIQVLSHIEAIACQNGQLIDVRSLTQSAFADVNMTVPYPGGSPLSSTDFISATV
jgi:hypothetical protein